MEKAPARQKSEAEKGSNSVVWDCGSSLYDSFELKSFERQLDSAMASRTLSMPHLPDLPPLPQPQASPPARPASKKSSKISRSFHKLFRSIFRPKEKKNWLFRSQDQQLGNRSCVVSGKPGPLSPIPEVPVTGEGCCSLSPEIKSMLVRRSASERIRGSCTGISCA